MLVFVVVMIGMGAACFEGSAAADAETSLTEDEGASSSSSPTEVQGCYR